MWRVFTCFLLLLSLAPLLLPYSFTHRIYGSSLGSLVLTFLVVQPELASGLVSVTF